MKKSLNNLLWNIYGFSFFNKLLLLSPVYAIFMQDNGMSDMQLSVLFVILSMTTAWAQIPVVWIIKKIGQKNSILLGQLLKGIGFIAWLVWPTFLGFALGMFLWGIMSAFYNTAFEGFIYDELKAHNQGKIYARVLGTRYNVQAIGSALAACGSLLMFMGYEWITIFSLIALSISMICMLCIKQDKYKLVNKTQKVQQMSLFELFKKAFHIFRVTPCIFSIMLLCLLVVIFSYLNEYLSPIGIEIGIPVMYVGAIQLVVLGCTVIGQTFAYKFESVKNQVLYSAICLLGGLFVLFSFNYSISWLWALCVAYILSSALHILLFTRFQNSLPSSYRTVILSLYSMLKSLVYGLMYLVMGWGGTLGSWSYSVQFVGVVLILTGIWAFLFIGNKCSAIDRFLKK